MEIDIRENKNMVKTIRFADYDAQKLESYTSGDRSYVRIVDGGGDRVCLKDKEHAINLIKALEKAIELGWLK